MGAFNLVLPVRRWNAYVRDSSDYPGAFKAPPGVTANLDNPPDAGRTLNIAFLAVCTGLITIFFAIRAWVKLRVTRNVLIEDVMCFAAWASTVTYAGAAFMVVESGGGRHAWDITAQQYEQVLKWLYASTVIYCPAAFLVKATLLLLIARVYAVERAVARATYLFIWFLLIVYIPIQILKVIICRPINFFWSQEGEGRCLPQRKIFLADSSLAIVSDLVILVIPIIMTVRLRMSVAKKIKIMCLLGAGGAATAVTVWRLVKVIDFQTTTDPTADWVLLSILTILELSIGLVCSCLPSVNLLVERQRRSSQLANPLYTPPQRRRRKKNSGVAPDMSELRKAKIPTPWLTTFSEQGQTVTLDFDCELALFPGNASNDTDEAKTPDELFVTRHATSLDGQREGWLGIEALSPAVTAGQSRTTHRDMTIDRELAQMSGNRPWDCIWDGSPNSRNND